MATPPRALTLDDAYRTCNPEKPLESGDERYQDLSSARGDDTTRQLKGKLTRAEEGEFVHVAFVSHRGAGKTTEILRVCADLKPAGFSSYYFEANLQLDERHITPEDLLLSLAMGVEEHFAQQLERPLPEELLGRVRRWFMDVIRTTEWGKTILGEATGEAGLGGDIPLFGKLKAELKALLRSESKFRTQVQDVFRSYPGTLLRHVNDLLDGANARLDGERLLIVIDNLDRYDPAVVDDLLFKGGRLLRSLRCHIIVTPPIALYYKPLSEPLTQGFSPELMYTVRLRQKDQPYEAFDALSPGKKLLLEALDKRMDVAKLIPDESARNRLVSASGGAIRDLLRLVRNSILLATDGKLDLATIERAAGRLRQDMRDRINANGWALTLARIMHEHQVNEEEACMSVLYQQLALRYNGEGWYDVHPLVAEIPEVQRAQQKLAEQALNAQAKP